MRNSTHVSSLLALAAAASIALAQQSNAAEKARVMLVLDASGSMWGKIGERTKIDIAKDVVGKVIGTWRPGDELGLAVYGHREKGTCDDIEVLSAPGPLDPKAFMATINAINPKGKTPMTAAVKIAAEALRYGEEKATVILVSDGLETCGLDPCSIATQLEKDGVDFTMHTVGFNVDDPAAKDQLKCMAENTGGIAVSAESPEELLSAMVQTVAATTEEPAPEPEPAPVEMPAAFEVDFKNGIDPTKWDIVNENKDGYGQVDGAFTVIGVADSSLDNPKKQNLFLAKTELPQGDFDLSVDFAANMSDRGSIVTVGIFQDEKEYVEAGLYRQVGSKFGLPTVWIGRMSKGKYTGQEVLIPSIEGQLVGSDVTVQPALDHLDKLGGRLTLSKRGVKVTAKFEYHGSPKGEERSNWVYNGSYTGVVETSSLGMFSVQGRLSLLAGLYGCPQQCSGGENIVRFEKMQLRVP
jgi:von Willebrand factor type A domain